MSLIVANRDVTRQLLAARNNGPMLCADVLVSVHPARCKSFRCVAFGWPRWCVTWFGKEVLMRVMVRLVLTVVSLVLIVILVVTVGTVSLALELIVTAAATV